MPDLEFLPMDWMELLKSLHSSLIQMAQPDEDVARKFVYKWEVKMIFPAPNAKLFAQWIGGQKYLLQKGGDDSKLRTLTQK
jgi:hypothetical protein